MRTDFRCVYCGREYHLAYEEDESQLDEVDREACPFCSQLYWDGYLARRRMLPMELCPWEDNRPRHRRRPRPARRQRRQVPLVHRLGRHGAGAVREGAVTPVGTLLAVIAVLVYFALPDVAEPRKK
jgi:DNA-directed RNA polymerase subunit RPC12/RpoP